MKPIVAVLCASTLVGGVLAAVAFAGPAGAATAPDVIDVVSVAGTSSSAAAVSVLPMLGTGTVGTPIALPTAAGSGNQPLTLSGSAGSEGQLSLSGDGRYLTLAGYAAVPGTGSVSGTSAASVPRVVGRVDASGTVDTSTTLGSDAFTGNNVRGATTSDGSRYWITGANGSATKATGGVLTAALGATTATSVSSTVSSGRALTVAGGNLYLATDKKPNVGVSRVGSGLPSTAGQGLSTLAGPADPYGFALVTIGSGSTPDTLYVADGTTGGITKYSLSGTTWTAKGTVGGGTALFGLAARAENGGVQLYATSADGKKVVGAFDGSGAGGTFGGSLATVSTAAAGTVYKGIAFGPTGQPAPGPSPVLTADDTVLGAVVGDPDNGTLGVTLSDSDASVDLGALAVNATSSNPAVAGNDNIAITGSGSRRTVAVTPSGTGYATITLRTTDPVGRSGSTSFTYGASAAAADASSKWLTGAADSSSTVDVGNGYVIVADDSTNVLRLFRSDRSGGPIRTWDIGARFGLNPAKGSDSMDLEAGARIGNTVWWTGSMGNSSDDGALRPNRSTLFATKLTGSGASTDLTVVGTPYKGLRSDLVAWDQRNGDALGLAASAAAGHLTKTVDGFNVEGMEFTADGSGAGYIGFRAPLERGSDNTGERQLALVVPVTNLASLTADGGPATFGSPLLWDLGGLSVREIRRNAHGQYLVLAGSYAAGNPTYRLYTWNGDAARQPVAATTNIPVPFGGWEAVVSTPDPITDGAPVTLVEDDGSVDFYGDGASTEAKSLATGLRKSRVDTVSLTLPSQSITFTTTPPASAHYGDSYRVAATGGLSGEPVTFSAGDGDSCTIDGASGGTDAAGNATAAATVTLGDVGGCTVTASQPGGTSYQPAAAVSQSFTVGAATPVITWPTPDPIDFGTAVSAEQLDARANVPGHFDYDVAAGTTLHAGDHVVTATFTPADNTRYTTSTASVTLRVDKASQRIGFDPLPDRSYGDAPVALAARGGDSARPVTFAATGACVATGTTLTLTGAGRCSVRADLAGDDDHLAAAPVVRTFTIAKATPTLTWPAPGTITYGTPVSAEQLDAAANVDGSYVYTADDTAGDPIDRVLGAGRHTLHVTFTPTDADDYTSASGATTLVVTKATPQLRWAPTDPALTYGDALGTGQLDATADVAGTFAYDPAAGAILHAGTRTLRATFTPADTDDYLDGTTVDVPVTVAKAPQTVAIADPGAHRYGDAPFTVTATGGRSGAPITFATDGPCTVGETTSSGSPVVGTATLTLTGGGACTLTASQSGSADYLPAADATRSVAVAKATPTITWPAPADLTYGDVLGSTQLNATASVPGAIDYTVDGTAYTSGTSGSVLHAGNHGLTATFTPDDDATYTAATASVNLTVRPARQTVTLARPSDQVYGTAPIRIAVSGAASGRPITVRPDAGSSCYTSSVSGGYVTATIKGAGSCGLTATQSGSADYVASAPVHVVFAIDRAPGRVTFGAIGPKTVGGAPQRIYTAQTKATTSVVLRAGPSGACSLSGTTVSFVGAGTCTVTADEAGDANFYAAPTASSTFTITYAVKVLAGTATVKAGTPQPIRLRLTTLGGTNRSVASVAVHAVSLDDTALTGQDFAFVGGSAPEYDYRLSTTGLAAGSHTLTFRADGDPLPHRVTFTVK